MRIQYNSCLLALCTAALLMPAWVAAGPSTMADLAHVSRSIGRQPTYRTKEPRYCLFVFGPRAKYRIWLVLDGDTLYVDRNGDGDLTESGKSTHAASTDADVTRYKPITIFREDGKTEEKFGLVLHGSADFLAGKYSAKVVPAFYVGWHGRMYGSLGDETGSIVWGTSPKTAPILPIGGPLQMGFEAPAESAVEIHNDGNCSLTACVGTKGLGKGAFVYLMHDVIPEGFHPSAVLEFQNKTPGGPPIRVHTLLAGRC